jgi:hypothetical protein
MTVQKNLNDIKERQPAHDTAMGGIESCRSEAMRDLRDGQKYLEEKFVKSDNG